MTFSWRYVGGYSYGNGGTSAAAGHRVYRDEAAGAQKEVVSCLKRRTIYYFADGCKTAFKTEDTLRKYLEADAERKIAR